MIPIQRVWLFETCAQIGSMEVLGGLLWFSTDATVKEATTGLGCTRSQIDVKDSVSNNQSCMSLAHPQFGRQMLYIIDRMRQDIYACIVREAILHMESDSLCTSEKQLLYCAC
jgi:hypothetical protein